MDPDRRKIREKRYKNRMLIAYSLCAIFIAILIAGWIITGKIVLAAGFILPVGAAYFIAARWEKKELEKNE